MRRLGADDLVDEIVHHVAIIAGERVDCGGYVLRAEIAQRQCGKLQPDDPAFGAAHQCGSRIRVQGQMHCLVEKRVGLSQREAQVGRTHFDELAAGPQASQRQGRVLPRQQHQMEPGRDMIEQVGQGVIDRRVCQNMQIVENQPAVVRHRGQIVEQRADKRLRWHRIREFQQRATWAPMAGSIPRSAATT